jgi:hypothetical protein
MPHLLIVKVHIVLDAYYHYSWNGQFIHVVRCKIQRQLEECDILDAV